MKKILIPFGLAFLLASCGLQLGGNLSSGGDSKPGASSFESSNSVSSNKDSASNSEPKNTASRIWDSTQTTESLTISEYTVKINELMELVGAACINEIYAYDFTQDGVEELCLDYSVGYGYISNHVAIVDWIFRTVLFTAGDRFYTDAYIRNDFDNSDPLTILLTGSREPKAYIESYALEYVHGYITCNNWVAYQCSLASLMGLDDLISNYAIKEISLKGDEDASKARLLETHIDTNEIDAIRNLLLGSVAPFVDNHKPWGASTLSLSLAIDGSETKFDIIDLQYVVAYGDYNDEGYVSGYLSYKFIDSIYSNYGGFSYLTFNEKNDNAFELFDESGTSIGKKIDASSMKLVPNPNYTIYDRSLVGVAYFSSNPIYFYTDLNIVYEEKAYTVINANPFDPYLENIGE